MAAQPTGGQVAAGTVTFNASPGLLTLQQSSPRAILTWQDFSVAAGSTVRFVQPDANSAALNRVLSDLPSRLMGSVEANGRVFLINPNGILVGAGARIDTGSFIASTLDVTDENFLAGGDLTFVGASTAGITNLGAIQALGGDVMLIARSVENRGTITAAHGTAAAAAGSEILLTSGGEERLFVQAASLPGTVVNAGAIQAATAELKAAGGNAYALAINNSGLVRATGTQVRNGQTWLVASGASSIAHSGTIDVSSSAGDGGRVAIHGGKVAIEAGAQVNASGAAAGGTIDIRGRAQVTLHGTLNADAGAGGTGGFIETSADHVTVGDEARVTTTAPGGRSGTWLIDPVDFTIAASGGDMTGAAVGTALAGGNFAIQSTTGGAGTAGDVNVNDAVSWSANRLTLNAQNNINFNAALNGSGTASLALEYGQGAVAASNPSTYAVRAAVTLPAGNNFTTKLGSDGAVKTYTVITSLGAAGSTTGTDLQGMNGSLGGNFVLGADIDAAATSGWNAGAGFAPVGTLAASFSGTFDGLGHTINNLTINRVGVSYVGMFGRNTATSTLRNVGLVGGSAVGAEFVGLLLGHNNGTVSNSYATGTASGTKNVGGLIGANLASITRSWATGNVSNVSGTLGFVGGLTGNSGSTGSITHSWATGNVSGTGPNVGGLVGFATNGTIDNTYATGTVSGINFVGGLVGSGAGPVTNSYATGNVSGTRYVGGLVGYIYSGITISNTYAAGNVTGSLNVGGLVGNNTGTVNTSFWNSTAIATGIGGGPTTGATGLTATEMKQMASFTGFSIAKTGNAGATWRIYEGDTTPWLTSFLTPLTVTAKAETKTYSAVGSTGGNGVTYSIASPSLPLPGTLAYSGTSQSAVNVGSYGITPSGLYSVQQGYDLTFAGGTLTINPANLTLSGTRVYDGTTLFAGSQLTATGVAGQTFTVTGAGQAGNLSSKNVQTNQLLASASGLTLGTSSNGGVASNYNPLGVAGSSVSVTPLALTLTGFAANDKVYDATTTAVVATPGTLTGVVTGDTVGFTHTGATFASKNVGTGITVTLNGVSLTGTGDQNNYSFSATTTESSSITPATLTYTADLKSRTYGATNPALTGTVTGLVGGETLATATTGTALFTTTAAATTPIGTYGILGSGLTATHGNYNFVQAPANATALTINRAPLTITADNKSRDANTANPTLTASYTGFVNGETSALVSGLLLSTTAALASPSGSYPITPSGATAANYTLSFVDGTLTVTPAAVITTLLTITAENKAKLYGAALPSFTATYDGFINGDTASVVSGLQFATSATAGANVGTYAITPFGATAPGYSLAYVAGILTINPAALTIAASSASRLYGAANPLLSLQYTGLVNGDTSSVVTGVSVSTPATTTSGVGAYAITPAGGIAPNYTITRVPGTLTVNPAPLTITAADASRVYGAANPDFSATYAGFVNGETASVVNGLTLSTAATRTSVPGTYAIVPAGAVSSNYQIQFVPGLLAIGSLQLTITADDKTKLYGAAMPVFTATFQGLIDGDTPASITGLQFATTATASANVGRYTITPFGAASETYSLVYVPGTLLINPAALTITAANATRVYGAANPALTASFAGLVNGDTSAVVSGLTLSTPAVTGSNVGSYAITPANASAANYAISYGVPGLLAVTRAPLTITASNASRVYGAPNPVFTGVFTGLVNGDTASSVSGLVFSSPATPASGVGSYAIVPSGATATNYALSFVPGSLTINRAPLTLTANPATREVGAPNPLFTGTFSGFVNGDTPTVVSGTVFSTSAGPASTVGNYTIIPSGATAANYALTFVNGTLRLVPPTVTVGDERVTVVVVGGSPAKTESEAVVEQDGRLTFVDLTARSDAPSTDEVLAQSLAEATAPGGNSPATGTGSGVDLNGFRTGGVNLGNFELVASGGSGGMPPAAGGERGLYRESSVNMGGFNVIYHEPVETAREQAQGNTALGSSYREFSEEENPQLNLVRMKVERKPGDGPAANGGRSS